MRFTRVAGLGHYVPERVVTNDALAALMDTSDAWIRERSGIRERRFAAPGQGSADLGARAARAALAQAGWKTEDVQFIIFATLSPDLFFPGGGVLVGRALDLPGIGALDVRNQCTGLRFTDAGRDTAVLFGDGGGAACLEVREDGSGGRILAHCLHADGTYARELCVPAPSSAQNPWITPEMIAEGLTAPVMNGREVFRHAVQRFPEVIEEVLAGEGLTVSDLDFLIPHQANARITEAVRRRLGIPTDKLISNIERFGNTTAASIPIAWSEAREEGRVKRGDLLCLAAFGSGFTWAASLLRY